MTAADTAGNPVEDSLAALLTRPPTQSQTKIFVHTVGRHMRAGPVTIGPETPVHGVVAAMQAHHATAAAVVDEDGCIFGLVTEHDIVHRANLDARGEEPVENLMSAPVRTIRADQRLYTAIGRMRRLGWRHMPVVDADERPVGMIRLTDALAAAAAQTVDLIERLTHEDTVTGLQATKAAQVNVADALLADNVPAPDVQALITDINRDLHQRVIARQLERMRNLGHGAPPVDFSAIVMGSGGRAENMMRPDQDNGLILDDYPDGEHDRIDAWFRDFTERVCRELDAIGFPWCKGYVMMINPTWRKTRSQWAAQIRQWANHRSLDVICMADLFFDFGPIDGRDDFARELRHDVTEVLRTHPSFLGQLHINSGNRRAAVNGLGFLRTVKRDQDGQRAVNLKHQGTLPLVQTVRLLTLRDGITETGTLSRLERLRENGRMSNDQVDYLSGAYRHLTELAMRQQIADFRANRTVNYKVPLASLSQREIDILRDGMKAINRFVAQVHKMVLRNKL